MFTRGLSDFSTEDTKALRAKVDLHFEKRADFIKTRLAAFATPAKVNAILLQLMSLIVGTVAVAHLTGDLKVAQLNKKVAKDLPGDD